jgi:hypothetical protein
MHLVDSFGHEHSISYFIGLAYISCNVYYPLIYSLFLHTLIQFWSYPLHPGLTYPVRQRQSDLSS